MPDADMPSAAATSKGLGADSDQTQSRETVDPNRRRAVQRVDLHALGGAHGHGCVPTRSVAESGQAHDVLQHRRATPQLCAAEAGRTAA